MSRLPLLLLLAVGAGASLGVDGPAGQAADRRTDAGVDRLSGAATAGVTVPDAGAADGFDSTQIEALAAANAHRSALGLPPFRLNRRLCDAAAAHSAYLVRNDRFGHDESAGLPGFAGATPGDRLRAFGYRSDHPWAEDVGLGATPSDAEAAIFDAPYHRLPFMNPGVAEVGIGYTRGMLTIVFAPDGGEGRIVVSPADGQDDVPLSWEGEEIPSPTRLHRSARMPVGYPILLSAPAAPGVPRLAVTHAELRTAGGDPVPCFLNTAANDGDLRDACLLIPEQPLDPDTRYTARVDLRTGGGKTVRHEWSFRTTAPPEVWFRAVLQAPESDQAPFRVSISIVNAGRGAVTGFVLAAIDRDGRRTTRALPALGPGTERSGVLVFDRRPAIVELTPKYGGARESAVRQTVRLPEWTAR